MTGRFLNIASSSSTFVGGRERGLQGTLCENNHCMRTQFSRGFCFLFWASGATLCHARECGGVGEEEVGEGGVLGPASFFFSILAIQRQFESNIATRVGCTPRPRKRARKGSGSSPRSPSTTIAFSLSCRTLAVVKRDPSPSLGPQAQAQA